MPRVLVSDKLEAPGLQILREAGVELDERHGLKGDALKEALRAADGVDMTVVGFDPFLAPAGAAQLGIETVAGLDELLPRVDFLTVHTPLTDETRDLIDARALGLMRPGARVINCARGGIVNEEAL